MTRSLAANLAMVRRVAECLGELRRRFLSETFGTFLSDSHFLDVLPGDLPRDQGSQQRIPILKGRMRRIADLEST